MPAKNCQKHRRIIRHLWKWWWCQSCPCLIIFASSQHYFSRLQMHCLWLYFQSKFHASINYKNAVLYTYRGSSPNEVSSNSDFHLTNILISFRGVCALAGGVTSTSSPSMYWYILKVQTDWTLKYHFRGIRKHYFIKIEIKTLALLEMSANTHSPFCPIWRTFLPMYHRPSKRANVFILIFIK